MTNDTTSNPSGIHPRHLAKPAVFVAQPIQNFVILGVPFEAYLDESGEVVFSEVGIERGFDIATGGMNKIRKSKIYQEQYGSPTSGLEKPAQDGSQKDNDKNTIPVRRLKVAGSTTLIRVVTKEELVWLVGYLAFTRGHKRAVSMFQASFATVLQQECDRARGIDRGVATYLDKAGELRAKLEKKRNTLRSYTGKNTIPTFGPNAFKPNNELVFGEGYTRNTYDGEDLAAKLDDNVLLEAVQVGLSLSPQPLSFKEVIDISHEHYRKVRKVK